MGEEAVVSKNFIEQEIEKIYVKGFIRKFAPDFHRNRTDTFTSDMQSLFC